MPLTLASNAITFTDSTSLSSGVISTEQLASSVQQLLVPAGCVMSFAMSAAPVGWYPCDGTTISRTGSGANLFAAIGTTYGVGNNTTTFNVPNLQGQFIRGLTTNISTASRDPLSASRVLGNVQDDEFRRHNHTAYGLQGGVFTSTGIFLAGTPSGSDQPTAFSGGAETRPVNIALLYCIKL
jgi:microcystin-dependent protein